jgi:hypothetical protein
LKSAVVQKLTTAKCQNAVDGLAQFLVFRRVGHESPWTQSGGDELHDEITGPGSVLRLGQRVEDAAPFGHSFYRFSFAKMAIAKQTWQLGMSRGVLKGLGYSAQVIL